MAESDPKKEAPKPFLKLLIVLVIIGAGVGYFHKRFEVITNNGQFTIRSRDGGGSSGGGGDEVIKPNIKMPPIREGRGDRIQIATFNAGPLDEAKFASDVILTHLAGAVRNFDLVALQDLRINDPGKLELLTKKLNDRGRHYEYVVSPGQGPNQGVFNAFLYDRASVEVDRDRVSTFVDPNGRLHARPLSALFRARGPAKDQAFTFVAVIIYVNPSEREAELDILPDILETAKENYPSEDDFILLASLQAPPGSLGPLENVPGITYAVSNIANMVQSDYLADNILFDRRATIEYIGESGVYDLARRLNLSPEKTVEVTSHLPVWAKFSVYEGGRFIK